MFGTGQFAFDSPKVEGNLEIGLGAGDGVICVSSFCFCQAQYIPAEPTATKIIITKATIRLFLMKRSKIYHNRKGRSNQRGLIGKAAKFTTVEINQSTKATIRAVTKELTLNPGRYCEIRRTVKAERIQFAKIAITNLSISLILNRAIL